MALDPDVVGTVTFLLPIITLFVGFLVLKWTALKVSLAAWIVEAAVILVVYPQTNIIRPTIWASLDLWVAFAVIWTGFLFRQMYANTGLLNRLVEVLDSLFKSAWGKALTLSGVVGGLIGAFNGYATYPITITGLKELGYKGWRAATAYLVFFSSSIPYVSLWVAATVAERGSHVPVIDLVSYMGLLTFPLVFLSIFGFAHVLQINLRERHGLSLLILTALGALTGRIIFTLVIPSLYLLTLIGSSILILAFLVFYGKIMKLEREKLGISKAGILRPFGPIIIGIVLIILWNIEPISSIVAQANYTLVLWDFNPININLIVNPGFYIFVIALSSYLFRISSSRQKSEEEKPPMKAPKVPASNPIKDIVKASKMSVRTLTILFFGSGLVGMMLSTGQIVAVRNMIEHLGAFAYTSFLSIFSFGSAMVFAEGLPADFLLSSMQIGVGAAVGLPIAFLVAIVATTVMGVADPLKPALLSYTAKLAEAPDSDEPHMFRTALLWQVAALIIIIIEAALGVILLTH